VTDFAALYFIVAFVNFILKFVEKMDDVLKGVLSGEIKNRRTTLYEKKKNERQERATRVI
jgi:hypothetical protein